jgi:hypothetical protein
VDVFAQPQEKLFAKFRETDHGFRRSPVGLQPLLRWLVSAVVEFVVRLRAQRSSIVFSYSPTADWDSWQLRTSDPAAATMLPALQHR